VNDVLYVIWKTYTSHMIAVGLNTDFPKNVNVINTLNFTSLEASFFLTIYQVTSKFKSFSCSNAIV